MADGFVPFHLLTTSGGAIEPGALAIALGAEFEPVDAAALDAALAPLVGELARLREALPGARLAAAAPILSRHLRAEPDGYRELGIGDLLPPEVAAIGRGHRVAVSLVALEAARRAALRFGLVADGAGALALIDPADGVGATLVAEAGGRWVAGCGTAATTACDGRCAAQLLLDLIVARSRESGLLHYELRAAELAVALSASGEEADRLRLRLDRVRARLN